VVTSRISGSAGAQSFGGARRGRVYVRVFIGVGVRACCERSLQKKEKNEYYDLYLMKNEYYDLYLMCVPMYKP
jgi:hypothetical protein